MSSDEPTILLLSQQPEPLRKRWIVLASFSLLTLNNSWIWITWSPIEQDVEVRWHVTSTQVDALSMVFMYLYIPLSFPALWLLNKIGMRYGLILGALINSAGAVVRWRGTDSYTIIYLGTILCSIAQTFTLAIPPLLSHAWFCEDERALATSIGVLANQLGTCFGLGATILVDMTRPGALSMYLGVQCIVAVMANLLIVCFVTNGTQQATEHVEEEEDNVSYIASLRRIVCSRSGFLLNVVYMLVVGCFYAVATFLSQFLPQWRADDPQQIQIGFLGITLVLGGVLGSTITGVLLDRKKYTFYGLSKRLLMGCFLASGIFTYVVSESLSHIVIFAATAFFGFFLTAIVSVGLEYGTELVPGIDEGIVAGVYNSSAQIGGCVLLWAGGALLGEGTASEKNILMVNLVLAATLLVSGLLFWLGVVPESSS